MEKNIGQEIAIKSYYQSVRDANIIDTNLCCKFGMEFFLSQLLFKGDLSKVVYSKEDIAFRRRVETLGRGDIKNDTYNYINLDLPYACYSQEGPYEEDDRGSTQNAGQIVLGQIQPDSGIILKAAAVKTTYNMTAFFARRDDVNIASQLLYWEKTPKFPVYFIVQHVLCGYPIDIPVFITLESIDSNVNYAEKEWLEKSKIFPVKCEFTIRSYQTLIESIDDGIKLPMRFSGLYGYNDQKIVYTQKTSLIWADSKWTPNEFNKFMSRKPQVDSMGNVIHLPQDFDPYYKETWDDSVESTFSLELKNNGQFFESPILVEEDNEINVVVADAVAGYFQEERDCVLDEYHQCDDKTTETSLFIEWKIKEADLIHFDNISLYIPGILRTQINDIHINTFELTNLYPGSEYDCTLVVTSKNFTKLTYKLTLKTKGEPVLGKKLSDNLVGRTFSNQVLDN